MVKYVEYHEDGTIFHTCEVLLTEGLEVEPASYDMTTAQKKARQAKVDKAIKDRSDAVKAELNGYGKRLIVLDDADLLPDHIEHSVDPVAKKVRPATEEEKAKRRGLDANL